MAAAFIALLCASPVLGQVPGKIYRLGALGGTGRSAELIRTWTLPELAKLGFVEGRNLALDLRVGSPDQLPRLAREAVALGPDAIFAIGNPAVIAAREATGTIPIVMYGSEPIDLGFAASLSRPGGNITGVSILAGQLDAKRLQLLHEVAPGARRVAALFHPSVLRETSRRQMQDFAGTAGIELLIFQATTPDDYPAVLAAMRNAGAELLMIAAAPQFNRDAALLARLAIEAGLPTACHWPENAEEGCLLGYGPSLTGLYRLSADYIARILKGTAPGELPIEGPTHFQLIVNLRTATALGLELPPTLLVRADEVIE